MAEIKKIKDLKPEDRLNWRRKMLKRKNDRKRMRNQAAKANIGNLKRTFRKKCAGSQQDEACEALRNLTSALDKAAKHGVLHKRTVNRRKSRLANQLAKSSA